MNAAVMDLQGALNRLSRDDLLELTIERLDRLQTEMAAWTGVMVAIEVEKRAAARVEMPE
jgi:hypothetical protein